MAVPAIYIDSSVWNACFDTHVPEMQSHSRAFLDRITTHRNVIAHISDVVLQEIAHAPEDRKQLLGALLETAQPIRLQLGDEAAALAEAYIQHGVLRSGHLLDAHHVAIATVAKIDAVVSWNYKHLVNRRRRLAFNGVNAIMGYASIDIVSPPEVFDE